MIYNWPGEIKYGLPLEIGDTVQILEECLGKQYVPLKYNYLIYKNNIFNKRKTLLQDGIEDLSQKTDRLRLVGDQYDFLLCFGITAIKILIFAFREFFLVITSI